MDEIQRKTTYYVQSLCMKTSLKIICLEASEKNKVVRVFREVEYILMTGWRFKFKNHDQIKYSSKYNYFKPQQRQWEDPKSFPPSMLTKF